MTSAAANLNAGLRGRCLALVYMLVLLCIGGCAQTDSAEARFDDYLRRLARTLDVARAPAPAPELTLYPDQRALRLAVETPRTGWIGFFQLHRCGLVNLVSERNSILGRVAPPQRRLAYESRLLAGLSACRARLAERHSSNAADKVFRGRLDTLIAIKRDAVPRIFWNLTFGDDALAKLFSVSTPGIGLQPTALGRASREALAGLAAAGQALADGHILSADGLAEAYRTLEYSSYGGQLQTAARQATAALDEATRLLRARLARRPVCFNQRPNRRARTLQTVLLEIYGPNVQSYLADLVRAGKQWRSAVAALLSVQHVALPHAFVAYRHTTLAADVGVWAALDDAIARHTDQWQELLGQCNLMPGS